MTLEITKSQKRDYQIFVLKGRLLANSCLEAKNQLESTLRNDSHHICLNLTGLSEIDATGIGLIENLNKLLGQSGRKLVTVDSQGGVIEKIHEKIDTALIPHYENVSQFENIFTEAVGDLKKKYFKISSDRGLIRSIAMSCPLCGADGIIGRLCDEENMEWKWTEKDIAPQWLVPGRQKDDIEFDLYEVSVCHACYFASAKIEHFNVSAVGEIITSLLKKEQIERVIKNAAQRGRIPTEDHRERGKSFFSAPLDPQAGWVAWRLYDRVLRDLPKNRTQVDCLEVARANIQAAKLAPSKSERNKSLATAQAWLAELLSHPESHVSSDLAMGYVFLISVYLAQEKEEEAKRFTQQYLEKFEGQKHLAFWTNRVKYIMED